MRDTLNKSQLAPRRINNNAIPPTAHCKILFATERTSGAIERLDRIKDILKEHGNYSWLTENGPVVILNNGIEFAATYFIMLFALMAIGGGKYVSLDYWIANKFRK